MYIHIYIYICICTYKFQKYLSIYSSEYLVIRITTYLPRADTHTNTHTHTHTKTQTHTHTHTQYNTAG